MKYIALFGFAFLLSSCNLFYKVAFGIKDPKMETYYTINKYASSTDIDSASVIFSKDSASYYQINQCFRGSPEIVVFNKERKFIPYKSDSISCNASVDTILKRICSIEQISITHKPIRYEDFISLLDDHNLVLRDLQRYDYLIFVDFAKYFHRVNKNHIPGWNNSLRNHYGSCTTKIIYVNLDYLSSWHISKESLPTFRLSANKNK
ncbi:MAG: hypothetical protein JWO44_1052 [Bacteroidetes bacterium]|nr:hypothetical protein [Bacteroidota bacterium]